MRALTTLIIAFSLASCGNNDDKLSREALGQTARDPQSIQLRNVRRIETKRVDDGDAEVICGEWNGANAFGGMGDWSPFVLNVQTGVVQTPKGDEVYDIRSIIMKACA